MKKKLLLGLTILGAASMLCGFDSAETADSVLGKMQEASSSVSSMSIGLDFNLDAAVNVSDDTANASLPITASGDFTIDYILSTESSLLDGAHLDGNISFAALSQGEDINFQTYIVTGESGDMETYTYFEDSTSGDSGWTYNTLEELGLASLIPSSDSIDFKSFDPSIYAEYGIVFELASEPADVNGTECYLLSTTIDTDTLNTMLTKISETTGEDLTADENVSTALSMLNGLKLNLQYSVDAATYLPVSVHIDMNGSDVSTLNTLISAMMGTGAEGTTMELVLNDASVDAAISYDGVAEITVPQEAIDAVAAGEADSVEDVLSDVEEEVAVG